MSRNVLVAVDFSTCSRYALLVALQQVLVNGSQDDTLTLMTVVRTPGGHGEASQMMDVAEQERQSTKLLQDLYAYMRKKLAKQPPVTVKYIVDFTQDIGKSVVDESKNANCTIIVVGSHGESAHARSEIGSVSAHILKHATVPVLICKDPDMAPKQQ